MAYCWNRRILALPTSLVRRVVGRRRFSLLVAALTAAVLATPATAQEADQTRLLDTILAAPSDLEASFLYAQTAAARGDFHLAAIALERILILNPQLSNIKLELGVLYLRMGASEVAARYIADALADPNAPPDVVARAEALLAEAQEANRRVRLNGFLAAGLAADSNANAGPSDGTVVLGRTVDPESTGQADISAIVSSAAQLRIDLGTQAGHEAVLGGSAFLRRYAEQVEVDIDSYAAHAGLAFNLARLAGRPAVLTLRGDVALLRRGRDDFLREIGPTAALRIALDPRTSATLGATLRFQDFIPTDDVASNNDRDGIAIGATAGLSRAVTERVSATFALSGVRKEADEGFEAYYEGGLFAGASRTFASPFTDDAALRLGVALRGTVRGYDEADPFIDPTEAQTQARLTVSANAILPFTETLALRAEVGFTRNASNYAVDDYSNVFGQLLIEARF